MPKHFEYVSITQGPQAERLAQLMADTIRARTQAGRDVRDVPAPPLQRKYAAAKTRRGLKPIRDWTWSGRTLRALQPLPAEQGKIRAGFTDSQAAKVAAILNTRDQQYGLSQLDRQTMIEAINDLKAGSVIVK